MKIKRFYHDLGSFLTPNKALVIYGSRRAGKTTLLKDYLAGTPFKYKLDSGDNLKTRHILGSDDFDQIREYAAGYELIAIDEAQRIPRVGQGLKILVDQIPGIRIIATGSSSFELSGQVGEPLTGRKTTLSLFPVAQLELASLYNRHELKEGLAEQLVFGSYPEVIVAPTPAKKSLLLEELIHSYLLKDILELERVKGSKVLLDLLRLVAFQTGHEVSLSELGSQVGLDTKTVARYLDLLEKSFVLFNLRGFNRNLRKEVTKKSKYYFVDNGIRNAVISNFNAVDIRNDMGSLWENFIVIERLKRRTYGQIYANPYFWRTWDQKEIDLVEERGGNLYAYECKWGAKRMNSKNRQAWLEIYPDSETHVVSPENYLNFVL
ncbi:ATP-binding protein [Candidatus Peregrinibacteria bacterium]|nr:ATP-binding protein [Candidatus Peregrinibacteria bacterium]